MRLVAILVSGDRQRPGATGSPLTNICQYHPIELGPICLADGLLLVRSIMGFAEDAILDNPIWNSLVTDHAPLAVGESVGQGLARRYPADIGPLSGLRESTAEAYADLAAI